MKTKCPHCNAEFDCDDEFNGQEADCPTCGQPFIVKMVKPALKSPMNTSGSQKESGRIFPIRKESSTAIGCFLPLFGLALIVVGVLGFITIILPVLFIPLGLFLFFYGHGSAGTWYVCSVCGTKLTSKKVMRCPSCKSNLEYHLGVMEIFIRIAIGFFIFLGIMVAIIIAKTPKNATDDAGENAGDGTDSSLVLDTAKRIQ